jgi:predicted small metal-binding protein
MSRKFVDCREFPSDSRCTLKISGEEEEVMRAAVAHAADVHGHKDDPELRDWVRKSMRDERETGQGAAHA